MACPGARGTMRGLELRYQVATRAGQRGRSVSAQSAYAATLTVDDDKADCPAAAFTSVQAAVDAAAAGDTVVICKGDYAEGAGTPGTNALTITKTLTLKGAGADLVTITPEGLAVAGGRILEDAPDLRNGVGDIVAIVGTPTQPLKVDISGVTVDGYDPRAARSRSRPASSSSTPRARSTAAT